MASTRKNVLLVVEGEREEPKLVSALFRAFNPEADWVVYEYRTVVHELIAMIVDKYDGDYENLELCRVLAEEAYVKNEVEQAERLLYTKFTDVILMFDFDPHDDRFDPTEMKKMMVAFCDSTDTDRGLLLINYPAIESVKESAAMRYEKFAERFVSAADLTSYKAAVSGIVGAHGSNRLSTFDKFGGAELAISIAHTVGKIQHLVQGLPLEETFPMSSDTKLARLCRELSREALFDYQVEKYLNEGEVATCGTGTFFIALWERSLDGAWKSLYGE